MSSRLYSDTIACSIAYERREPFLCIERRWRDAMLERQFYGILEDHVVLVRIESPHGEFVRNSYTGANAAIGPPLPMRNVEQWEDALAGDWVEVLRSLVFLTAEQRTDGNARFVAAFLARPTVRARLEKLAAEREPWIREAAQLALATPPRR